MKLYSKKLKRLTQSVTAALLFISVSLLMTSCEKPGDTFEAFEASGLRVVNGLTGKSGVKFYLDTSNLTLTGTLNFTAVSQYYVVKSGLRTAKFFSTSSADTFAKKDIQLDANKDYTLFLAGIAGAPKYFLTEDDLAETTPDKVKIRLANLGVTGSNVDVTIQFVSPDPLFPLQPEVSVLTNVASESISNYALATVPTSKGNTITRPHTIRVYESGTTNLLATASGIDLRGTTINTIILTGVKAGSPALALRSVREWLDW